jgi:hypothetical protein
VWDGFLPAAFLSPPLYAGRRIKKLGAQVQDMMTAVSAFVGRKQGTKWFEGTEKRKE